MKRAVCYFVALAAALLLVLPAGWCQAFAAGARGQAAEQCHHCRPAGPTKSTQAPPLHWPSAAVGSQSSWWKKRPAPPIKSSSRPPRPRPICRFWRLRLLRGNSSASRHRHGSLPACGCTLSWVCGGANFRHAQRLIPFFLPFASCCAADAAQWFSRFTRRDSHVHVQTIRLSVVVGWAVGGRPRFCRRGEGLLLGQEQLLHSGQRLLLGREEARLLREGAGLLCRAKSLLRRAAGLLRGGPAVLRGIQGGLRPQGRQRRSSDR